MLGRRCSIWASGGGIDVLLSARRVGPTGKGVRAGYDGRHAGVARENQRKAGVENVEFLKGEIEHIPLPDNSVDVIIRNCVINLSGDKDRVLREAFRVSETGRAVCRVGCGGARRGARRTCERICCCGSAASPGRWRITEYAAKLAKAGFDGIEIEADAGLRHRGRADFLERTEGIDVDAIAPQVEGKFMSAFIRATKPAGGCCAPGAA